MNLCRKMNSLGNIVNRSSVGIQHSFSVILCGEEDGLQTQIHSTSSVTLWVFVAAKIWEGLQLA